MTEEGQWLPECEQCQELLLIKGRCEEYRLQTIELKRKLKEANTRTNTLEKTIKETKCELDQLQKINKSNDLAAKEDVRRLQQLVKDQRNVIDNFHLMLKLGSIK